MERGIFGRKGVPGGSMLSLLIFGLEVVLMVLGQIPRGSNAQMRSPDKRDTGELSRADYWEARTQRCSERRAIGGSWTYFAGICDAVGGDVAVGWTDVLA